MIKERMNMEHRARIVLIFSISSLILYLSVEGLNFLPSIAQPNSKLDKANQLAKDQGSPVSDEASRPLLGPVSSSDEAKAALATTLDETKQEASPISSGPGSFSFLAEAQISTTPASSPLPQGEEASLWDVGESQKITPSMVNGAESVLGPVSSSNLGPGTETSSPVPSPSLISKGAGFFDHDIALAIEARIKQSQSDSQLAVDEARKLLKDPNIASLETGKCLSECVDRYTASLNRLNRAVMDLGVRDVTLLADDFGAVETDISTCQACFTESMGEDSPFKALEEATTKAARECLTVMDYASYS